MLILRSLSDDLLILFRLLIIFLQLRFNARLESLKVSKQFTREHKLKEHKKRDEHNSCIGEGML